MQPDDKISIAPPDRESEVLTIIEVAAVLRCSKAHVSNLLSGRIATVSPLPYFAVGRRKLVTRSALRRWIEHAETKRQ